MILDFPHARNIHISFPVNCLRYSAPHVAHVRPGWQSGWACRSVMLRLSHVRSIYKLQVVHLSYTIASSLVGLRDEDFDLP